ncbi:MAG: alginate O-acetyltransferase complex protein AlgI [Limisphaerales bacterium]|jgi:alginate O-acetyltransferase complex protein AlgI
MLFNSFEYLLFLPFTVVLYFLLPWKWRWLLLLIASYIFYATFEQGRYIPFILITTISTYLTGREMAKHKDKKKRKPWMYASLFINLGLLFYFKYSKFAIDSLASIGELFGASVSVPEMTVLGIIGISFYTFQSLSYTLDVYNGRTKHEKHFGVFALYVAFFPQLVMGPIERSGNLLPQLKKEVFVDYNRITHGLCKIAYGFFKKLVIADRLKLYVDEVHFQADGYVEGPAALIATYFFAIQMYCDFSGYSDIAIGTARLMGVELMENFKKPFLAKNISDFWVRWHISATTWFMDYVFVPMGGYTPNVRKTSFNLLVVAMVTGLWHGAKWTFVIAFGIMGVLMVSRAVWIMVIKKKFANTTSRLPALPGWMAMFLLFNTFCICTTYIRSIEHVSPKGEVVTAIATAHTLLGKAFSFGSWPSITNTNDFIQAVVTKNGQFEFVLCLLAIFLLFASYLLPFSLKFGKRSIAFLVAMFFLVYFLGYDGATDFFYFQF